MYSLKDTQKALQRVKDGGFSGDLTRDDLEMLQDCLKSKLIAGIDLGRNANVEIIGQRTAPSITLTPLGEKLLGF